MREIPQCWLTGQAAGAAAALCGAGRRSTRALDVPTLQNELRRQGVFLHDHAGQKEEAPAAQVATA